MFEAIVSICLGLIGAGPCRDALLPGYEAATMAGCESALLAHPPGESEAATGVRCRKAGPTLQVEQVAPAVFVHQGLVEEPSPANRGNVSNAGFIIGGETVAVVDTGGAAWVGEALWRAIRQRTDKPVSHVILTHMHPDHVLGVRPFLRVAGVQVVGHARLPRALADRQDYYLESLVDMVGVEAMIGSEVPVVSMTVEETTEINLGSRVLEIRPWPTAHSTTDLTVHDRASNTLFAGDLVFHRHAPALDGSLRGWRKVLEGMEVLGARRVVPGHGGPALAWPDAAETMKNYLDTLAADTAAAIAAGERMGTAIEHIARSEADDWELFEVHNPRNATVAFTELEWE